MTESPGALRDDRLATIPISVLVGLCSWLTLLIAQAQAEDAIDRLQSIWPIVNPYSKISLLIGSGHALLFFIPAIHLLGFVQATRKRLPVLTIIAGQLIFFFVSLFVALAVVFARLSWLR